DRRASFPGTAGDVEDDAVGAAKLEFGMRAGWHLACPLDAGRAHRLELAGPFLGVVDHHAEVVDADVVDARAELVGRGLEDRKVERTVGEKNAGRARRLVRLVGIEAEAAQLTEAERLLVELGGLARMIAGERDVADLQHVGSLSLGATACGFGSRLAGSAGSAKAPWGGGTHPT